MAELRSGRIIYPHRLDGIRIWSNGRASGDLEWYARKWSAMAKFVRIPDIPLLPHPTYLHLQTQSEMIADFVEGKQRLSNNESVLSRVL